MNDLHEITGWPRPQVRSQPALRAGQRPRVYDLGEGTRARAELKESFHGRRSFTFIRSGRHRAAFPGRQTDHHGWAGPARRTQGGKRNARRPCQAFETGPGTTERRRGAKDARPGRRASRSVESLESPGIWGQQRDPGPQTPPAIGPVRQPCGPVGGDPHAVADRCAIGGRYAVASPYAVGGRICPRRPACPWGR